MVSSRVQLTSSEPASRPAGRGRPCQRAARSSVAICLLNVRNVRGEGRPITLTPRMRRRPSPVAQVSAHTMEPPPATAMRSEI